MEGRQKVPACTHLYGRRMVSLKYANELVSQFVSSVKQEYSKDVKGYRTTYVRECVAFSHADGRVRFHDLDNLDFVQAFRGRQQDRVGA